MNKTVTKEIKDRLEYLKGEIEAECISYSEIAELQGLKDYIDPGDTVLLEWAGVPEFPVKCKSCERVFEEEEIIIMDDDYENLKCPYCGEMGLIKMD